jgi:hypothetical protein
VVGWGWALIDSVPRIVRAGMRGGWLRLKARGRRWRRARAGVA